VAEKSVDERVHIMEAKLKTELKRAERFMATTE